MPSPRSSHCGPYKIPSDPTLQAAIDSLASAYQTFYRHNGSGHGVKSAVDQAAKKVNALCPGAGTGVER